MQNFTSSELLHLQWEEPQAAAAGHLGLGDLQGGRRRTTFSLVQGNVQHPDPPPPTPSVTPPTAHNCDNMRPHEKLRLPQEEGQDWSGGGPTAAVGGRLCLMKVMLLRGAVQPRWPRLRKHPPPPPPPRFLRVLTATQSRLTISAAVDTGGHPSPPTLNTHTHAAVGWPWSPVTTIITGHRHMWWHAWRCAAAKGNTDVQKCIMFVSDILQK